MPQAVTNDLWNKRQRAGIAAPRATSPVATLQSFVAPFDGGR